MDPNDWTLTGNAGTDPTTNFLGTTDNELLVINPVGNVNIGTFDSAIPYPKLTVTGPDASGDIETTEVLRVMRHGVPGFVNQNSAGFFVGAFESGTDGRSQLDITVAGTPGPSNTFGSVPDVTVMSLLGNGNVGIGTTTPGGKLEIVGDIGNDGVRVRATNGTGVFASSFSPDGFGGIGLHAVGAVPAAIVAEGGDFSGIQAVGAGGITPTQPSTVVGAVVAYGSPGIFVQNNTPSGQGLTMHVVGGGASPDEPPRIGQPALFVASGIVGEFATSGIVGQAPSSGVLGICTSSFGSGVFGFSNDGTGVLGESQNGKAGVFRGFVEITRDLTVDGSIIQRGGGFLIDHPKDPAHKSLFHSFVESPDMKNIYDGVVVFDAQGEAEVTLPAWFDVLNTDFRYQLTAVGAPEPDLYIAEELTANRFKIAGGKPHMKVSWQVTGIRQDAWAKENRLPVEQDKPA